MRGKTLRRTRARLRQGICTSMTVGLVLTAIPAFAQYEDYRSGQDEENTLLVWAGDKAHEAPDFLAVVDFDRDSRH